MKRYLLTALILILCSISTPLRAQNSLEMSIEGSIGSYKSTKSSYLGTQIGASGNALDFVKAGDHNKYRSSKLSIAAPLTDQSPIKIIGAIEKGRAHNNISYNTLDPAGNNLLIPGVGIGAAGTGFFLAGPNNQISGGYYQHKYSYNKTSLGFEYLLPTQNKSIKIMPSFAVEYSQSIHKNSFVGNIPVFIRSFAYDTKVKVKTISPVISFNINYAISPYLSLIGGAHYAFDFNNGNGKDTLNFTGFAAQTAGMSNDHGTHRYRLKTGLKWEVDKKIAFTLEGEYQKIGNIPVVDQRDGIRISDFSYKDADVVSGTLRATYRF